MTVNRACEVVLEVALLGLVACAGPEAPDDRPRPPETSRPVGPVARQPRPETGRGLALEAFAKEVAAAWVRDPAPVAVLPAFSEDPQAPPNTQVFATAAGDVWAAQVLAALVRAEPGIEVWAPETVVLELERNNRSLCDVRAADDAMGLVARTAAGYLVYGTLAKQVVGSRLTGTTTIVVRSTCVRLPGGDVVAMHPEELTSGDLRDDLRARLERGSTVLVGPRASAFVPSLDRELELTAERALRRLVRAHRAQLAGRRCALVGGPGAPSATVLGALRAEVPRALPGREALSLVEPADAADCRLEPSFERGVDRYALVLSARRPGVRDDLEAREPIDPRFTAELRRLLP
ncbi:MAG: hypothetical protein R3F56_02500 [Planctomycetota bacterium]